MSEHNISFCQKISLINWKNWNAVWAHRKTFILSLTMPTIFVIILIILRILYRIQPIGTNEYKPIRFREEWRNLLSNIRENARDYENYAKDGQLVHFLFAPKIAIAYAPNTDNAYKRIMEKASEELDYIEVVGYSDAEPLRRAMLKEGYLAGVKFHAGEKTKLHLNSEYPEYLNYSLIFPSELRHYDKMFISSSWRTNSLYNVRHQYQNRNDRDHTGGYVGYVREGFISIQNAISMAYIELVGNIVRFPRIIMSRFPYKDHNFDPFANSIDSCLSQIILIGFLYPCMQFIKYIMLEKEMNLKAVMLALGISELILLITWYIKGIITLFLASVLLSIALKIHWADGYSICNNSSWILILSFLACYNIASVAFCYMVSSMFSRTLHSVIYIGILWIVTYMPHIFTVYDPKLSGFSLLFLIIFSNSAMAYGIGEIMKYEKHGWGLHWENIFEKQVVQDRFSIGTMMLMLLAQFVVYTLIGLYMGCLTRLYHTVRTFIIKISLNVRVVRRKAPRKYPSKRTTKRQAHVFEIAHEYKRVGFQVIGLSKTYKNDVVVNDVNISCFKGEITVLMGHNGAGKTTIIKMINGMVPPTRGSILIDEVNVKAMPESARLCMSFCLQTNTLFPDLTVENQIKFFSRIKGLTDEELDTEVVKYLKAMQLQDKANVITRDLTEGLKRHLNVCCALCGDSKYVLLDEPSSGMDLNARKLLWDLLISEKDNRSMLITSHSTQEVEVIGDRIGIMSGGELKCHGSAYFLNKIYGRGYRLICTKAEQCQSVYVTEVVRKYIPDIEPEFDIGPELSYRIPERQTTPITQLLQELESKYFQLKISRCGITDPTIEDLILNIGSEYDDGLTQMDAMNEKMNKNNEFRNLSFLQNHKPYEGFQLVLCHWQAMILKRLQFLAFYKSVAISQIGIPALITWIIFFIASYKHERVPLGRMTYHLTQYSHSVTVVEIRNNLVGGEDNELFKRYRDNIELYGLVHTVQTTGELLFQEYIIRKQIEERKYRDTYLVGATLGRNEIIAWFNNYPLHTAPLSLNMVHNAILDFAYKGSQDPRIIVSLDPLPFYFNFNAQRVRSRMMIGHFLATNLTLYISFMYSICILYMVNERRTGFKLLQYICGVRPFTFLASSLLYDFIKVLMTSILIGSTAMYFQRLTNTQFKMIAYFSLVLIVFGLCIVTLNYVLSMLFTDSVTGFSAISVFNMYGGILFSTYLEFDQNKLTHMRQFNSSAEWVFGIFPQYSLCTALLKVYTTAQLREICSDTNVNTISVNIGKCKSFPNCCDLPDEWTWEDMGILTQLMSMLGIAIISIIQALLLEYCREYRHRNIPRENTSSLYKNHIRRHSEDVDKDIVMEELRVNSLRRGEYYKNSLVMKGAGKHIGDKVALNRLFLIAEKCECLGLIGINGSGKSTLLKVLTGDELLSFGRVYVNGISLTKHLFRMYQHIGYCPSSDAVLKEFTYSEILRMMCLLRGIPRQYINTICVDLANVMCITKYFNMNIDITSPGCRRRLGTAIAMIGSPSVVYFDEYASGIDPALRRHMSNIVYKMCHSGKTVIFTATIITEVERICSRIGIITDGSIQYIGTPKNLNDKYIKGFLLRLKVNSERRHTLSSNNFFLNPYLKVQTFLEKHFPHVVLKEHIGKYMVFLIPAEDAKLSGIFKKIQKNRFFLNIEDFSVTCDTLPLTFSELADMNSKRISESSV